MTNQELETQTIDGIKTDLQQQGVVTPQEPTIASPQTPVAPIEEQQEWEMMTVEELLAQEQKKRDLEQMSEADRLLLQEITWKVQEKVDLEKKWEEEVVPVKSEGDEPEKGFELELLKIKQHADEKVFTIETKANAEKKIFEATVNQLQDQVLELNRKLIETKTQTIDAKDDLVVHFNYLRNEYEQNKDDPKRVWELSKFHLRSAAVYNSIDPRDLEQAVELVKKQKENVMNWFSSWYNTWSWVYNNSEVQKNIEQPKRLNKNLL